MTMPEIMTTEEVASLLRVTPHHVRNLAKAEQIPHMRIGKEYRFVRDELIARFPNLAVLINQASPDTSERPPGTHL